MNFQIAQDHNGFVRYISQYGYVDNNALTAASALWQANPFGQRNDQNLYSVAGGWTWVINPSTVNEFRAQYAYYLHEDVNGVPCLDLAACVPTKLSFPSVNSTQPFFAQPGWVNYETKVEFMNNFSKQIGNHSLKVGVDYARLPTFYANLMLQSPGLMAFFHDPSTIVNNTNGLYPQGFQTPGIVRSITQSSLETVDAWSHKAFYFAGFAQDDWKVSPKLTLNLGLRYDLEDLVNGCCWDSSRTYKILKDIGHPYGALPKRDTNNLAPRLGVAYDLHGDGTDVLRGSFGVFYGTGIITSAYFSNLEQQETVFVRSTIAELGDRPGAARELCLRREPAAAGAGVRANRVPARRQRPGTVVHARFRRPAIDEHVHWILASAQSDDGPVGRLPARADAERVALPADQSAARHRQQSRHAARAGAVGGPAARLRRPGAPRSDQHPVFVQSRVVRRD